MRHLHTFGVLIGHAKTRKTLCGVRVKEADIAINGMEADCAACRAIAKEQHKTAMSLIAHARETGTIDDKLADLERALSPGPLYTNAEILRHSPDCICMRCREARVTSTNPHGWADEEGMGGDAILDRNVP